MARIGVEFFPGPVASKQRNIIWSMLTSTKDLFARVVLDEQCICDSKLTLIVVNTNEVKHEREVTEDWRT